MVTHLFCLLGTGRRTTEAAENHSSGVLSYLHRADPHCHTEQLRIIAVVYYPTYIERTLTVTHRQTDRLTDRPGLHLRLARATSTTRPGLHLLLTS